MLNVRGFDNEKYLAEQTAAIKQRRERIGGKLYLEFGGKLTSDLHAARVLPGFDPDVKMRLLGGFRDMAEIIICLYAGDIERKKIRADFGITYDADVLRLIDRFGEQGLTVAGVVINRYEGQPTADLFRRRLEHRGVRVYTHRMTKGYPTDLETIVSDEGYGANSYVPTTKPIVVVTAPGPGSGKLATCLSQLYHEHRRGVQAGYAKYESFPVWNMPLKHPLNLAYEAATADLGDVNLIDHFHLEAYDQKTVNYNRDLEAFPILQRILQRITGQDSFYRSPTDMGVNRIGFGIVDDDVVRRASCDEIVRRYFRYSCECAQGITDDEVVQRVELIMKELGLQPEDRAVVIPAREAAKEARAKGKGSDGIYTGCAIELPDGSIVTGKNSPLLHAEAAAVLNAIKPLAGIPDSIDLLPASLIHSLAHFKKEILGGTKLTMNLDETLIALSLSGTVNPVAEAAVAQLPKLRNREVHTSHIPSPADESALRKLNVNLTSDPHFSSKSLFED